MRARLVVVAIGCGSAAPPPPARPAPVQPAEPSEAPGMPVGYVEMHADRVVGVDSGGAVLLVDAAGQIAVPIFIGGTEASSIEGRLHGQAPPRPLTHDLLDHVLVRLHASLVKVQVDALRDDTFIGSIFLKTEGRIIKLDARPSDAIALALGNHVPIYVARAVVDAAGVRWEDIQRQLQGAAG